MDRRRHVSLCVSNVKLTFKDPSYRFKSDSLYLPQMDPDRTAPLGALGKRPPSSGRTADGVLQFRASALPSETPEMLSFLGMPCLGRSRRLALIYVPQNDEMVRAVYGRCVGRWTAFSSRRFLLADIQLRSRIQFPHHIPVLHRNGESRHAVQLENIDRRWCQ